MNFLLPNSTPSRSRYTPVDLSLDSLSSSVSGTVRPILVEGIEGVPTSTNAGLTVTSRPTIVPTGFRLTHNSASQQENVSSAPTTTQSVDHLTTTVVTTSSFVNTQAGTHSQPHPGVQRDVDVTQTYNVQSQIVHHQQADAHQRTRPGAGSGVPRLTQDFYKDQALNSYKATIRAIKAIVEKVEGTSNNTSTWCADLSRGLQDQLNTAQNKLDVEFKQSYKDLCEVDVAGAVSYTFDYNSQLI